MKPSEELTIRLIESINKVRDCENRPFNLAISGGNSPVNLFNLWSGKYKDEIDWTNLRIFWVDERCVPHNSPESNYGIAKTLLLDKVPVNPDNVFPIDGEKDPLKEALRYENQFFKYVEKGKGFDMVILGIGDDGHTSSIFPGQTELLKTERIYLESVNPYTNQRRVALTANGILRANDIAFYLSGDQKRSVMEKISTEKIITLYPSAYIIKKSKNAFIFWDKHQSI